MDNLKTYNQISEQVEGVTDGFVNPLSVYIKLNELSKYVNEAIKDVKQAMLTEAAKYPKTFEFDGYHITQSEGRRSLDYSNVHQVTDLSNQLKALKKLVKEATISGQTIYDENGEQIEPAIQKYSEAFITIKPMR